MISYNKHDNKSFSVIVYGTINTLLYCYQWGHLTIVQANVVASMFERICKVILRTVYDIWHSILEAIKKPYWCKSEAVQVSWCIKFLRKNYRQFLVKL